jgi:hypothetical protein
MSPRSQVRILPPQRENVGYYIHCLSHRLIVKDIGGDRKLAPDVFFSPFHCMISEKHDGVVTFVIGFVSGCIAYVKDIGLKTFDLLDINMSLGWFMEEGVKTLSATIAAICIAFGSWYGKKLAYASFVKLTKSNFGKKLKSFFHGK